MSDFSAAFQIPIYTTNVQVSIIEQDKDLESALKSFDPDCFEESDKKSKAITLFDYPKASIYFRPEHITYSIIAHESDHIAHKIMREVGVRECSESEEAYSYLMDWILQQIIDLFRNNGIEIS